MDNATREMVEMYYQLNPQSRQRVLRLMDHIVNHAGFSEAYSAFIAESGGEGSVGILAVNRFMDEWDKAVEV